MEIAAGRNIVGAAVIAVYIVAAGAANIAVLAAGTAVSVGDIAVSVADTAVPVAGTVVIALYIAGTAADTVEHTVERIAGCVDGDIAVNTADFATERCIVAAGTADNSAADGLVDIVESSAG